MELLCVRLITRRNHILSLPTYVKRRFRGPYRQTELTVKSPLLSSIELSGKSCRTTDSVRDLVCQLPRCQPRPSLLISSRTGLLPATTPVTTLPTHGSVSLLRHFHTSSPLRAIPAPLLWLILKPLQKILAIIVGRNIRKWWADLPPNRRQLFWEGAWRRRWQLVAGTTVAVAILAVILLTHLDESPVTGRTRILMVTREDYMELAAITADGYMEQYRDVLVPEQDSRHQAVQMMVQHLALRNRDIPQVSFVSWRVHVVDDPAVNAFVLPNGEVFMFTGMLEAISDVHQLAIILGHEMAHALIEHAAEEASVSHILDFLFVLLLTAIWAVCPRDSLAVLGQWIQDQLKKILFSRPYSRKLETEADEVGLHLAAKACADVRAGPVLWQQMELRGGAAVPEWLSTHPSHSSRATHINSLVPQALEVRASCNCPPLPSADPRVVFSESVRALLGNAKKPLPPQAASSERRRSPAAHALSGGVAVALLAPTQPGLLAPVPETTVVLAPVPETTMVLAPAPALTLLPAPETTMVPAPALTLAPAPETTVVLAPALTLAPAPSLAPAPALTPDRPPPV